MQKILALALITASLAAFPAATPAFAVEAGVSALCGPDGPEAYKRPGGYCEQLGNTGSLMEVECDDYLVEMLSSLRPGEKLLVGDACHERRLEEL